MQEFILIIAPLSSEYAHSRFLKTVAAASLYERLYWNI
jgi:hypothetical protein